MWVDIFFADNIRSVSCNGAFMGLFTRIYRLLHQLMALFIDERYTILAAFYWHVTKDLCCYPISLIFVTGDSAYITTIVIHLVIYRLGRIRFSFHFTNVSLLLKNELISKEELRDNLNYISWQSWRLNLPNHTADNTRYKDFMNKLRQYIQLIFLTVLHSPDHTPLNINQTQL